MTEMITIGIDAHTQVHVAAAVDAHGRVLDEVATGTDRGELARMLAWIQGFLLHGRWRSREPRGSVGR